MVRLFARVGWRAPTHCSNGRGSHTHPVRTGSGKSRSRIRKAVTSRNWNLNLKFNSFRNTLYSWAWYSKIPPGSVKQQATVCHTTERNAEKPLDRQERDESKTSRLLWSHFM